MGYPANLKGVSRKLAEDLVITSTPFLRLNKFNFGARQALFNYDGDIIVWSALPYGPEVIKSLELLTGAKDGFNVTHLIIPDKEHYMAAKSFKDVFPNLKIFAPEGVSVPGLKIDYKFNTKLGNKLVDKAILKEQLGVTESVILDSFEFVYLPFHENQELVVFDKRSKFLFEADLLFNLGVPGTTHGSTTLEQYSPETGYKKGFNPHSGWSFPTRYMQPDSKVGNFLANKLVNSGKSVDGLKAIHKWDFTKIIPSHGNLIEKDAKAAFKKTFKL